MMLRTERLLLREYEAEDWRAVLTYQSKPRYLRYYHWTHRTEEDAREFVGMFLRQQKEEPRTRYPFAIVLPQQEKLIGNCNLRLDAPGAQTAEIGYELDPEHWGHGYATEAARAIVALGFEELKLHRIAADCIAENTGSARVMEKIGMWREGRLRENEYFKGRWWDTLLYAILDHEWTALPDAAPSQLR